MQHTLFDTPVVNTALDAASLAWLKLAGGIPVQRQQSNNLVGLIRFASGPNRRLAE